MCKGCHSYCIDTFMSKRSVHMCPTKGVHVSVSWEQESNSGLAQALSVLVGKSYMVADRILDARSPGFTHPSAHPSSTMDFAWTPNFEATMLHKQMQEEQFQQLSLLCDAGFLAKYIWNKSGGMVNYIWDKAKNMLVEEVPEEFGVLCETYNLSNSVSMQPPPSQSPEKQEEQQHMETQQQDVETQPQNFVATQIERLNKLQSKISELEKKNDAQSRMIALYNLERKSYSTATPEGGPAAA